MSVGAIYGVLPWAGSLVPAVGVVAIVFGLALTVRAVMR